MVKSVGLCLVSILFFCSALQAQVWQWSSSVTGEKGPARAFLWIPPACKTVRGVIIAQNNMEEISILENPGFREAMSGLDFAEVYVSPFFDHSFNFKAGAGEIFNAFMDSLAVISGYSELRYAPIVGIGHSAAASWPYYFAAWNPQRSLAAVSVSGQWPYVRNAQFSPDVWNKEQNIDFIPSLETMGEYEAANTWSAEGLKERNQHPFMPLSMLAAPAEGHFAASQKKIDYIILYIKKAVQYRMPKNIVSGEPPKLQPLDPTKTGWLMDKWRYNQLPAAQAAPVGKYTGDTTQAFWFFDEEMVRATEKYEADYRNMKADLLGYEQEGKVVRQKNSHLQVDLKFLPEQDGITFHLKGVFMDTVPGESPRLTTWAGLPVGSQIGHARGGGPIVINRVSGPFKKSDPNTFTLWLEKGWPADAKTYTLTFAATHPGDNEYKPAVQQAQMILPARLTEGADQQITFPVIPDQKRGVKKLQLYASSSAHVPVYYYVLSGPAEVEGDVLTFTQVPPRTAFPVKVTVVAWQYGRSMEPRLKTADSVEQTFLLN